LKELRLPADLEAVRALEAGEGVHLSGPVVTMRDAACRRLEELLERGEEPPFRLEGEMVFHAGPSPAVAGRPAGAMGPTTAARMDSFLEMLFEQGVVGTLGKGPRGVETPELHRRFGAVYLVAVGGAGALLAGHVVSLEPLAWEELGPEAVQRAVLDRFPLTVAIDSSGHDFLAESRTVYAGR